MVSAWVINFAGIIFAAIAVLIIIIKIFPRIGRLADSIFNDDGVVGNLMSLLVILVYILFAFTAIGLIKNIDNKYLNYISLLDPGVEIFSSILPYLKWVIFALLIAAAFKQFRK